MKQGMLFAAAVLCCCVFLLVGGKLQAQSPAVELQQLSQALSLSPEQKTRLLPILEAEAPKIADVKNNPSLTPKQRALEIRTIHQQSDPEVERILSAQQYKEWEVIRQQELERAMEK